MSDYMFMLENHLGPHQARLVAAIQSAAAEAGVSLFLTGGAMRDVLGGFPIRDLDFVLEGNPLKLAKALTATLGGSLVAVDDSRKLAEAVFPGGVTASIGMARQEKYAKPGGRPQVLPATIHEDLLSRDFTINAIALSLNRASRGLLLDPTNGLADLEHKELRAIGNYTLYDDPARLLRLIRLRVRLGFTIAERTRSQYENARQTEMEKLIPPKALLRELKQTADEPNPGEVVQALDQEGLLKLFSPALTGAKLNLAGLAKLHKVRQLIPFGVDFPVENLGLFLHLLTEKLAPKEKAALVKTLGIAKEDVDAWQKLEGRAKKVERDLKSGKLQKASQIYKVASAAAGEELLFLLVRSTERLVQDRLKNYLQKHLPAAQEVTVREVAESCGAEPGTPKFEKARAAMIAARLDSRPKRPAPEPPAAPPPPPAQQLARARS